MSFQGIKAQNAIRRGGDNLSRRRGVGPGYPMKTKEPEAWAAV